MKREKSPVCQLLDIRKRVAHYIRIPIWGTTLDQLLEQDWLDGYTRLSLQSNWLDETNISRWLQEETR